MEQSHTHTLTNTHDDYHIPLGLHPPRHNHFMFTTLKVHVYNYSYYTLLLLLQAGACSISCSTYVLFDTSICFTAMSHGNANTLIEAAILFSGHPYNYELRYCEPIILHCMGVANIISSLLCANSQCVFTVMPSGNTE